MSSKSNDTFLRSDPSTLVITLLGEELEYRSSAQLAKDEKKFLDEKIRCTACNKHMKNTFTKGDVRFHPSFEVIICKDCEDFYATGDFSVDEDGSDKYCRWCGQGGSLYCCSKCSVAICEKCVKINFPRTYRTEIEDDEWKCFICDSKPIWPHRAIAAAVREYLDKHKPNLKQKRRSSDDSDSSSLPKSKRARNDSSGDENCSNEKVKKSKSSRKSKIVVDSSTEDDTDSKSKRSKEKKDRSSPRKSKIVNDSSSEDDTDSKSKRSKEKKDRSSPRKSKIVVDSSNEDDTGSKSKRSKEKKERSSLRKSSKKSVITISDDETEDEDSSVANRSKKEKSEKGKKSNKNDTSEPDEVSDDYDKKSRRSSKKARVEYKEKDENDDSREGSRKSDSKKGSSSSISRPHSKKITDDDLDSDKSVFRDKSSSKRTARKSCPSKSSSTPIQKSTSSSHESMDSDTVRLFHHLLKESLKDVDKLVKIVADRNTSFRKKYINDKQHLQNPKDARVVKEKYIAFVDNIVTSAKRIQNTFISDVEPLISCAELKRTASRNTSELPNGVKDKLSAENTEKRDPETKIENEASTETEENEFQNTSLSLNNDAETSKSRRKSPSLSKEVSSNENDTTLFSDEKGEISMKEGEGVSVTNGMEDGSDKHEDDEMALGNAGISDSMIVNLGTEDESIVSEKLSTTVEKSCEENSDDEKSEGTKKLNVGGDKSRGGGRDGNSFSEDDDVEHSKSKEELAKNDLLQNSESSSENERRKIDDKLKKSVKNAVHSRSPSPMNKSSDIAETKEKQAKSDLLNESDDVDEKNEETNRDVGEGCHESKEKKAKNELLKSSDSSISDQHSKSSSDSGMSGVDVLKKSSDGTKSV